MTKLTLYFYVKFRAFGITYGHFEKTMTYVLPAALPGMDKTLLSFNERGVKLELTQEPVNMGVK